MNDSYEPEGVVAVMAGDLSPMTVVSFTGEEDPARPKSK